MNRNTIGKVSKRSLLFIAAAVWTFAGTILIIRGYLMLKSISAINWLDIFSSIIGGMLFYIALFSKISRKHIRRIVNLKNETNYFYSFFDIRSYLMMTLMITMGVSIRLLGHIPLAYLSLFYMFMGTPLLLSSFRFYYAGFRLKKTIIEMSEN